MNLPDAPTFRAPTPAERPWWWRLLDASGATVDVAGATADGAAEHADLADQRFATQADAESWVGEIWADLAAAGVDAVMLVEHERDVYGPMSLHA